MTAEYLFIVARDRVELYGYFKQTFAGDDRLKVILEQRAEERRRLNVANDRERRRGDRRAVPNIAAHLPQFGFAVVRLKY
jgi:hypothetical protein